MPKQVRATRRRLEWSQRASHALMNRLNALSEKDKFYYAGVADTCVIVLKELGIEIPQSTISKEISNGMFNNIES